MQPSPFSLCLFFLVNQGCHKHASTKNLSRGQISREGTENDKRHCVGVDSEFAHRDHCAKNTGTTGKTGSYLHGVHLRHTHTHTHTPCFQINWKGHFAPSYHCIQLYLTPHSPRIRHWYLSTAVVCVGLVRKPSGFHRSLEVPRAHSPRPSFCSGSISHLSRHKLSTGKNQF